MPDPRTSLHPGFVASACLRFTTSACIDAERNHIASCRTPAAFPAYHQRLRPYIFSESEVARLLNAAADLKSNPSTPLRPEVTRLAIVLLFTTGIRRGELLKLTKATTTGRSRPCIFGRRSSTSRACFRSKPASRMRSSSICVPDPAEATLPRTHRSSGMPPAGAGPTPAPACTLPTAPATAVRHRRHERQVPRIQDFRHCFAVNALLRWYRMGADVEAKLPLLATYLGHGSAVSTHHYLHFIEPIRTAASERFAKRYGNCLSMPQAGERRRMKTDLPNLLGACSATTSPITFPAFGEPAPIPSTATGTASSCCYGFFAEQREVPLTRARSSRSGSAGNPRVPFLPGTGAKQWRGHPQCAARGHSCVLPFCGIA